jgi:hypothetical protein
LVSRGKGSQGIEAPVLGPEILNGADLKGSGHAGGHAPRVFSGVDEVHT